MRKWRSGWITSVRASKMGKLKQEYRSIKRAHRQALKERTAKVSMYPSMMRVFSKGCVEPFRKHMLSVPVDELPKVKSHAQYKKWFERELERFSVLIKKCNRGNKRIMPGRKWGHGTKVLCIYIRDLVLYSRYFTDKEMKHISQWLYLPIDGVVIRHLKKLGVKLPFKAIKEINTPKEFYGVQDELRKAADSVGVPLVWLDDIWGQQ